MVVGKLPRITTSHAPFGYIVRPFIFTFDQFMVFPLATWVASHDVCCLFKRSAIKSISTKTQLVKVLVPECELDAAVDACDEYVEVRDGPGNISSFMRFLAGMVDQGRK